MDRHARAAATQGDMETIEENDFTRLITSSSFMTSSKLRGPNVWTPEETELFYRGLRMFGTEFEMISRMFPRKQRRHIKLKFNREERHNPKLIDAALIGEKTMKMDIDEYKALTSTEFESVESIEAEHRRAEEAFEAERKRIADEQEEAMRKKREELFADDDEGDEGGAEKTKKKGKRKGKKVDPSMESSSRWIPWNDGIIHGHYQAPWG
jgi:transcription factor TFIIIB component B''